MMRDVSLKSAREMNLLPWGYIAWLLCVTGAVISSMPQWFIVYLNGPASNAYLALAIGLPILLIGSVLLVIAWLPERRRPYPEILETTPTPVPRYYLEEAPKGP
jgi:hypothetical protein